MALVGINVNKDLIVISVILQLKDSTILISTKEYSAIDLDAINLRFVPFIIQIKRDPKLQKNANAIERDM